MSKFTKALEQAQRERALRLQPVPAPPVWTGAIGPKALAVTGRLADGWVPGRGADWLSAGYRESRPVIDEAVRWVQAVDRTIAEACGSGRWISEEQIAQIEPAVPAAK